MKTGHVIRFGVAICCLFLVVANGACSRSEDFGPDVQRNGQVALVATSIDGKVSVRIENGSRNSVVLADEPLIGFGQGGSRVGIVLRDESGNISPCAHLDPPRYARPPTTLEPGQVTTRTVSMDLIRKVYCLKPGRYELLAAYPAGSATPITSPKITVEIAINKRDGGN